MKYYAVFLVSFFLTSNALDRAKLAIRPRSQPGFILEKTRKLEQGDDLTLTIDLQNLPKKDRSLQYLGKWYLQARLKPCTWAGSDDFEEWTQLLSMRSGDITARENWYNRVCTETSAVFIQNQKGEGCFTVKDSFEVYGESNGRQLCLEIGSDTVPKTGQSSENMTCPDNFFNWNFFEHRLFLNFDVGNCADERKTKELKWRCTLKGCRCSTGDVWSGDNVVVATDYKSFAISRGCTKPSVDEKTCVDTYVTVKTRIPFPKPRTWKVIEAILKKLFDLSLTEMKRISHKNRQCLGGINPLAPPIGPIAGNLVQVAGSLGATALLDFATAAGLAATLASQGPFTIFAPTNAAFDAIPGPIKAELSRNTGLLRKVLLFHVLEGEIFSNQLSNDLLAPTLSDGLMVRINIYGQIVTANGAKIIDVDKRASNGVIHIIHRVMFPLPTGPIPSIVADNPILSTLLIAFEQAGLVGALKGKGPFTLLAPTNEAFDGLRPGVLDGLLANTRALEEVLKYHLIPATVYSAGITSGPVTTLLGREVHIRVTRGGIKVNDAKVITADIPATNGVVHIIDCVLLPK